MRTVSRREGLCPVGGAQLSGRGVRLLDGSSGLVLVTVAVVHKVGENFANLASIVGECAASLLTNRKNGHASRYGGRSNGFELGAGAFKAAFKGFFIRGRCIVDPATIDAAKKLGQVAALNYFCHLSLLRQLYAKSAALKRRAAAF